MGWFFSFALMVAYIINGNTDLIVAAGLFAIAGVIGSLCYAINESGKYIKIPVNTNKK